MKSARQCDRRRSLTGFPVLAGILLALLVMLQSPAHAAYTSTWDSYGEKFVYGYSGEGRELVAYKYGTGDNVMVLGFEIHGYEDNFAKDGQCLVYTAYQVIDYLKSSDLVDEHDWAVYVLPMMNPDGLESGTTCNGPGRCTTTCYDSGGNISSAHGIDMNRSFPTDFTVRYTLRNYTGPQALYCRESEALYNFVTYIQGSGTNILFDVHGWEQSTIVFDGKYGTINSIVSQYFTGNTWKSGYTATAGGYLTTWAHSIGYTTCLLEMPAGYYSYSAYVNSSCSSNMVSVVKDLLQTTPAVHHHSYRQSSIQQPTCTAAGVKTLVCSGCGDTITETIPAKGHSWDSSAVTEAPTCTAAGIKTLVCSGCGDTITETIPAKGHQWVLSAVTEAPTATQDGSGTYACSVCGAVKQDAVSRIFTDTSPGEYYAAAVDWAYDAGITYGEEEHIFGPYNPLTRAMLVTMLYRMAGKPETVYQPVFEDVQEEAYYAKAVVWAYQNGIVAGTEINLFSPDECITREQLAAMLYRYAARCGKDNGARADLSVFTDAAEISEYAVKPIQWCVANGILYGEASDLMAPGDSAERCQSAAMLYRLKNYLERQPSGEAETEPDKNGSENSTAGTEQEGAGVPAAEQQETPEPVTTAAGTDGTAASDDEAEDTAAEPENTVPADGSPSAAAMPAAETSDGQNDT